MIIFHTAAQLTSHLQLLKKKGLSVGFVPTMGALHQGHLSLIEQSRKIAGATVASIFVNPTQFNNPADFEKYPNTIPRDIELLLNAQCDVLFLPKVDEIYPNGTHQLPAYELGFLETVLEGYYRPGHFQGVCQVMDRLLQVVQPDHLVMGLKDYQQCMVVRRLISLKQWQRHIQFHGCPTLREKDGLAMSSRNLRLTPEQRIKAVAVYEALMMLKEQMKPGALLLLKDQAKAYLQQHGFKVDYVEITDAATLQPLNEWDGDQKLCALIAAFTGEIRLIDNMLLND
ncbi:MAG TPA: pantoate--beta-alanine ligase [Lacibacter sp.]|nr:pantoate--beta-alanine ligase [Lacibacter sp.]